MGQNGHEVQCNAISVDTAWKALGNYRVTDNIMLLRYSAQSNKSVTVKAVI